MVLTCDPSLASVFARIDGISAVIGHRRTPEIYHDFWVPAMSAARVLNTEYEDLNGEAYLKTDVAYDRKWKSYFKERYGNNPPKIGLRFFGNSKFEHEQHRRFPVEELSKAVGDRQWVSLQLAETDLPIENWEDTLAVMNNLDLIITSCTSVAHAAAALGKKTWIIIPVLPYYIWALPGDSSPWYNSVRLFRQKKFGDWANVFDEIKEALATESV